MDSPREDLQTLPEGVEAFPANGDNRVLEVAGCELVHLDAQAILRRVCKNATRPGIFQANRPRNRYRPELTNWPSGTHKAT
jgi:hypothetical protein